MCRNRTGILVLLGVMVCGMLVSCKRPVPAQWRHMQGCAWSTTYHITYLSREDLTDTVQRVIRDVELSLSAFNPSSAVSRVNRGETDTLTPELAEVFNISRRVNAYSNGRFDPTVAPLINLWGFGPDMAMREEGVEPTQEQIDSALALVGIDECRLKKLVLKRKAPGTQFNFSAIAKGYGADCIGQALERNGCTRYMVEMGGDISLRGMNPKRGLWRIAIDQPDSLAVPGTMEINAVITATDCGIATSGNYRNWRQAAASGKVGHTIDPYTGRPETTNILSATVVAPTCAEADAYATACMASPRAADALRMISNLENIECLLIVTNPKVPEEPLQIVSPHFPFAK